MSQIDPEKCREPLLHARPAFDAGLTETLARHIRALESVLIEAGTDVARISLVEDLELPCGFARMTMTEATYMARAWHAEEKAWSDRESPLKVREIFIVYGAHGKLPAGASRPIGDRDEAEWHHGCRYRLAIAHELAHLALGHCFHPRGTDGLPVPGAELSLRSTHTPEEEWSAYAYAVVLLKLSSDYIELRGELLRVSRDEMEDELSTIWGPVFWNEPLSKAYVAHTFGKALFEKP